MTENIPDDGFTFPVQGMDGAGCRKCHADAMGGTYPIGSKNKSWHSGLHFVTDKPIVAIYEGEVVAWRFTQEALESEAQPTVYSDSFVLLRHMYKSTLGNTLDFYSLYMHLEPVPQNEFLPAFLGPHGWAVKNRDKPAPGLIMYERGESRNSIRLVPKFSYVTLEGELFEYDGKKWQNASYTDIDGMQYEGKFKYKPKRFLTTADGKTFIASGEDRHYYGSSKKVYNCCKDVRGARIFSKPNGSGKIVGFIPEGMEVEVEETGKKESGWVKLVNPLPDSTKNETCYVAKRSIKNLSTGQPDPELLGSLIVPDERPVVDAGDVIGGPGPFIFPSGKTLVHVEVFTLQDLESEECILGDPHDERYFSNIKRYMIPEGTVTVHAPLSTVALEVDDMVEILEDMSSSSPDASGVTDAVTSSASGGQTAASTYVNVQVVGITRTVKYKWLNDKRKKILCEELGRSASYYLPKKNEIDNLNAAFNGWITDSQHVFYIAKVGKSRKIFLPCRSIEGARVWIKKDAISEPDSEGKTRLLRNVTDVYSENPANASANKTSEMIIVDDPEHKIIDGKRYIAISENTLAAVSAIDPITPFSWAGFELMGEDPSNHDAFMDFDKIKSSVIVKKGEKEETSTAAGLQSAIKNEKGNYDIRKIAGNQDWSERLEKLIVKVPSEWHFSDEKYSALKDNIDEDMDPEVVKEFIKSMAFWDECKKKDVFEELDDASEFSADAKDGKQIWCFHPLGFINHMNLLLVAGLTSDQISEWEMLVGMVRSAAGSSYSDPDTIKAIAAAFANRLKKHEWIGAPDFHTLAEKHTIPVQEPTGEEYVVMVPHIAPVFVDKGWERLAAEYVFFHPSSESVANQPWDVDVLDCEHTESAGLYTFYKYKPGMKTYASELCIKEITLTDGGEHGTSLGCKPGDTVTFKKNGKSNVYHYNLESPSEWTFSFRFNIENGTEEMERQKDTLIWELQYFSKEDGKYEEKKVDLVHDGSSFKVTLPADINGYTAELVPIVDEDDVLNSSFKIGIKKDEQLIFNGGSLMWVDPTGTPIPFEDNDKEVDELDAFTGGPGKNTAEYQKEEGGPIPEGQWYLDRSSLEAFEDASIFIKLGSYLNLGSWEGGKDAWGSHRIGIRPDTETETYEREDLYICGGTEKETNGNIHLGTQMKIFLDAFTGRLENACEVLPFLVDYSRLPFNPPSKYLSWEIKNTIMRTIAKMESGSNPYGACNRDLEFEGRWDLPLGWYKNKETAKPDSQNPKIRSSKYYDSPRHVGLSFGLIQFTQVSSLHKVVLLMHKRDPMLFKQVFGMHSDKLLNLMKNPGPTTYPEEEVFDNTGKSMGRKKVKRDGRVQPIAGHDLWEQYWVDKFKKAATYEVFQNCQIEIAITAYMDKLLKEIVGKRISMKSLTMCYDRMANEGGEGRRLVKKIVDVEDEKQFWEDYWKNYPAKAVNIKNRMRKLLDSPELRWDEIYEVRND